MKSQPITFQKNYLPLLNKILVAHQETEGNLLPILHALQVEVGFIPESIIQPLAEALNLTAAEVYGVISFYPYYRTQAPSNLVIELCQAEACQSMGATQLYDEVADFIQRHDLQQVELKSIYCLGLCAQSPAALVNEKPVAKLCLNKLKSTLAGATHETD